MKKKEKVFDPLGTSLEGEQDHEISGSIKLLSYKFTAGYQQQNLNRLHSFVCKVK